MKVKLREVYVENLLEGSLIGGVIAGVIGKQIKGGSGKEIASVQRANTETNHDRTYTRTTGNLQIREVCRDVVKEIQKGKYVTLGVKGALPTIFIDE